MHIYIPVRVLDSNGHCLGKAMDYGAYWLVHGSINTHVVYW